MVRNLAPGTLTIAQLKKHAAGSAATKRSGVDATRPRSLVPARMCSRLVLKLFILPLFLLPASILHGRGESNRANFKPELDDVIRSARDFLFSQRVAGDHWNYAAPWGQHYVSMYYIVLKWTGRSSTVLDANRLRRELLATQRADGSWDAVADPAVPTGNIGATVINYLALKMLGESPQGHALQSARQWILANGGIEAGDSYEVIFLALTGNVSWARVKQIPLLLFDDRLPINFDSFSIWTAPVAMPIAFLRFLQPSRSLGPDAQLQELTCNPSPRTSLPLLSPLAFSLICESCLAKAMISRQEKRGSWGGNVFATMLTLVALEAYAEEHPEHRAKLVPSMDRAQEFIETLLLRGARAYQGVVLNGSYWDTVLVLRGLRDSGISPAQLQRTYMYLLRHQDLVTGGFAHGTGFESIPDPDNTAEVVSALSNSPWQNSSAATRALAYLFAEQHPDGGWPSWNCDRDGNAFLRFALRSADQEYDIFDSSVPCVTGHVVEALGDSGYGMSVPAVRNAVAYLENSQDAATGTWFGRWGVNRLYGTEAALSGLAAVGFDMTQPRICRAVEWLHDHQNPDGGFGESTQSYNDPSWWGRGPSTPSQTAIALIALVAAGDAGSFESYRAANYLVRHFHPGKGWINESANGTVQPGTIYMVYPGCWPEVMALSRYRDALASRN